MVKNLAANAGDAGLIPGSGRSPGRGYGNPLQYSCLENPMDRAQRATVLQIGHDLVTNLWSHTAIITMITYYTVKGISKAVSRFSHVRLFAALGVVAH